MGRARQTVHLPFQDELVEESKAPASGLRSAASRLHESLRTVSWISLLLLMMATGCSTRSEQLVEPGNTAPQYEEKLKASPASSFERLGRAVEVAGQVVVVSSLGSFAPNSAPGAVYVFRSDGERWLQEAKLTEQASYPHGYGHEVSTDGTSIVVTAPLDSGVASRAGAAFLYRRSDGEWQRTARLEPNAATSDGLFGTSMSMHSGTLAIGAPGGSAPHVYLFSLSDGTADLDAILESPGSAGSLRFGSQLAVSTDWLAVGAGSDDEGARGAVYLYRRSTEGSWELFRAVEAPSPGIDFGTSLAIDETSLLVGSAGPGAETAVHAYRWNGTEWREDGRLEPEEGSVESTSHFGSAVSLGGRLAVVGAPGTKRGDWPAAGVAYVFQWTETGWRQLAMLEQLEQRADDAFGAAVATDGGLIVVGATGDDEAAQDSGAAHVLRIATEGDVEE